MKEQEMLPNSHEQARHLIDKELVEGLDETERNWLQSHLARCEACAASAEKAQGTVRAIRAVSVAPPTRLAAGTILRVREEATRLKQQRARNMALIAGCAVSWIAGIASAPLVWRVCEWVGTRFDLPKIVWGLGFLSWWLVPAASAGLVILWVNARAAREEFNGRMVTEPRTNGR